jgi:hypothetical protein
MALYFSSSSSSILVYLVEGSFIRLDAEINGSMALYFSSSSSSIVVYLVGRSFIQLDAEMNGS